MRWLYGLPLAGAMLLLVVLGLGLGVATREEAGRATATGAVQILLEADLRYAEVWRDLEPQPGEIVGGVWGGERFVLVNFFASWCAPCHAEHGQLMALSAGGVGLGLEGAVARAVREDFGLYGIVWRDRADAVAEWLGREGNPYGRMGMSEERVAAAFSVVGVPTSVLLDLGAGAGRDGSAEEVRICWHGEVPLLGGQDIGWRSFVEGFADCVSGQESGEGR